MQDYEGLLHEATAEEVLAQLAGEQGLVAVTRGEILYVNPQGVSRAPLHEAKRVVSAKKLYGGRADVLVVASEQGPLFEVPVKGFDPKELQEFFGSVKTFVARARQQATFAGVDFTPPAAPKPANDQSGAEALPPLSPPEAPTRVPEVPVPLAPPPPARELPPAPEPPPPSTASKAEPPASRPAPPPPAPQTTGNSLFQILGIGVVVAGLVLAALGIPAPATSQRLLVGIVGVAIGGALVWLGRRS